MTRQQLIDIAAHIQSAHNTRHPYDDMHIVAEVKTGSNCGWIDITPWQMAGHICESIFWPEEILAFASVYNLNAHFSAHYDYEQRKAYACICMFPNEKYED